MASKPVERRATYTPSDGPKMLLKETCAAVAAFLLSVDT